MLALDLVSTVAVAGVVLFAGYGLRRAIPLLARLNLPAPVVGGLVVAIAMTVAHSRGVQLVRFDTTLQTPLQNAFFTSIGSVPATSSSGSAAPSSCASSRRGVGRHPAERRRRRRCPRARTEPLLGVLAGSVTLTGGPATGLAFAPASSRRVSPARRRSPLPPRWPASSAEGLSVLLLRRCCWSAATSRFPGGPRRHRRARRSGNARCRSTRRRAAGPGAIRRGSRGVCPPEHLVLMLVAMSVGGFVSRALAGAA